jgi:hypothetical protein
LIGFIPVAKTDLRRYLPLGKKKPLYCYLSAHPISLGVLAELWGLDSRRFTVRIPIRTGDFLLLKKVQTGHGTRLWASAAKLPGCELNLHVAPRLRMSGSIPPFPIRHYGVHGGATFTFPLTSRIRLPSDKHLIKISFLTNVIIQ